jgi:hypothetical protein
MNRFHKSDKRLKGNVSIVRGEEHYLLVPRGHELQAESVEAIIHSQVSEQRRSVLGLVASPILNTPTLREPQLTIRVLTTCAEALEARGGDSLVPSSSFLLHDLVVAHHPALLHAKVVDARWIGRKV